MYKTEGYEFACLWQILRMKIFNGCEMCRTGSGKNLEKFIKKNEYFSWSGKMLELNKCICN